MASQNIVNRPYLWKVVPKTSDQSKTNDVSLAADSALQVVMRPAKRYIFRLTAFHACDTNPGIKWRYAITGNAAQGVQAREWAQAMVGIGAGATFEDIVPDNGTSNGTTNASGVNGGFGGIFIHATVLSHATLTSTFEFQWAQNNTGALATIVYAGSYLEYLEI